MAEKSINEMVLIAFLTVFVIILVCGTILIYFSARLSVPIFNSSQSINEVCNLLKNRILSLVNNVSLLQNNITT